MNKLRVLELFGGIGACSKALEKLGIDYEISDYVEIDKYAVKSFNAIHNTNFEPQNITQWDKDIDVDLIMHGSPCQDFSVAGKGAGGDEGSGTRSSLMYETLRIVSKLKPKYVIWENVKNLLSKKHRHNFDAYLEEMEKLGYRNYYQVLNAKDYGIPQNRERVFTISVLENVDEFEFPVGKELKLKLKDMLEDNIDEKYFLNDTQIERISKSTFNQAKSRIQENNECDTLCPRDYKDPKCVRVGGIFDTDKSTHQAGSIYDTDGLSPTLDTMQGGWRQPNIVERTPLKFLNRNQKNIDGDYSFCVDSCNTGGIKEIYDNDVRIRKLTPKECWRLMGFDDEDFDKASKVNSNAQLYKQAGNSIVVNVLMAIFNELLKKEGE